MAIVAGVLRQTGYDTLDMERDKVINGLYLDFTILVSVGTDDRIACLAGLVLNAIEHCSIVMGNKIGHHHTDNPGGLLAETLRKGIRPVVHLFGQGLNLLLHLATYLRRIAQSSAHSSYADTQFQGQIFQRRAMFIYTHNVVCKFATLQSYIFF